MSGFCLGASVDMESDGQPSLEANGDDRAGLPMMKMVWRMSVAVASQ